MGINGTIRPQKAAHGTIGISPSSISGKISVLQSPGHVHGVLPSRQQTSGTVVMGATQVHSTINVIPTSEGVPYSGAYEVTPKTYVPVVLETMRRTMRDNVTVEKIPQFEVSNESGGTTLIIGEEYYG